MIRDRPRQESRSKTAADIDLAELIETMADGVVVSDGDGRIVFVNRQAEQLSGYSRDELVGRSIESLVPIRLRLAHAGHRERYSAVPRTRAMGSDLDIQLLRRDGREIPVDIMLSPLTANGSRVVAVLRDISDKREADKRLREQAQLLELAHYSVLVRAFEGDEITYWNQGAVETYGYSRTEAIGKVSHILLRTLFPVSRGDVDRLLVETGQWDGELTHTRQDGTMVFVSSRQVLLRDDAGHPMSIFQVDRDITEERRARGHLEAVLELSRSIISGLGADAVLQLIADRAQHIVGAALAAIAIKDREFLVIRAASGDRASRLLGMQMPADGSISGRAVLSGEAIFVPDLSAEARANSQFVREARMGPALFVPLSVAGRNIGTLIVANLKGSPPFSSPERRVLEELFGATAAVAAENTSARAALLQMAKLEDRERIARELHDGAIQTLFAVGMSLQSTAILSREPVVSSRLEHNVSQLDDVIRDLRNYIFELRPSLAGDREIGKTLGQMVADFESETGVTTELEVDQGVASRLELKAHDIHQLALEALSNVRRHAEAKTCRLVLRRDGEFAVLVIADDGKGFLTKRRGRVGGQGLRNLRERSSMLGGTLTIESEPGAGTRVQITVPL